MKQICRDEFKQSNNLGPWFAPCSLIIRVSLLTGSFFMTKSMILPWGEILIQFWRKLMPADSRHEAIPCFPHPICMGFPISDLVLLIVHHILMPLTMTFNIDPWPYPIRCLYQCLSFKRDGIIFFRVFGMMLCFCCRRKTTLVAHRSFSCC